jgi:hypothetical protein
MRSAAPPGMAMTLNPAVDFEWRPGFAAVHNHCE